MPGFRLKYRYSLLLIAALLIAAAVRLPQINGDPPAGDISRSGVFLADEGTYAFNALHWFRTGAWYVPDTINPAVNTPVFTLFEYIWLSFSGVSLASIRFSAVFCGLVALVLLFVLLKKESKNAATIGVLLGAINFPLVVYNRLALVENLLLCFILAAVLVLLVWLRNPRNWLLAISFWLIIILGYLTKASMIFLGIVFLPMFFLIKPEYLPRVVLQSGLALVLFLFLLWHFWISPYQADWNFFHNLNIISRFSLNPLEILQNYTRYVVHLKLFEFMPITYLVALVVILNSLLDLRKKIEISTIRLLLIIWYLAGVLLVGFFAYSPPRYSLILMPAILGLNGLFFAELISKRHPGQNYDQSWVLWFICGVVFLQTGFGLYRYFILHHVFPSCFLPVLGLAVYFTWFLVNKNQKISYFINWILFLLIFLVQGSQVFRFHRQMQFSLYKTLHDVAKQLQQEKTHENIVVAGDSAALIAFEADVQTIDTQFRQDRLPKLIRSTKPQYLFLTDPAKLLFLQKQMPDYWQDVQIVKRYRIMNNYKHGEDAILAKLTPHRKN